MSTLYRIGIPEILEKLRMVKELNHSATNCLYIEMNNSALNDLLSDPDLDLYVGHGHRMISKDTIEQLLGARIFTHNDNDKRYVLTITFKTDFLVGEKRE